MLLGSTAAKTVRSVLTLCGTLGIVATNIATLQFGYLTLTVDLVLKLFVTYAYAHGLANIGSILRKAKVSTENDGSTTTPFIPMQEMSDVRFEDVSIVASGTEVTSGQCQRETSTLSLNSMIGQPQCIATIVGWREDDELYRRCLRGFAGNPHCAAVVAGIDGNASGDEQMVKVFLSVFPDGVVIRLQDRLSQTLDQYMLSTNMTNSDDEDTRNMAMEYLCSFVHGILREELFPQSIKDIRAICVVQPHYSKKDILLTALTFASAISAGLDIQYLFSTDSDSIITPDALGKINTLLESDSNIGGVSGHLRFFHPRPTFLSRMTTSHYWFEQEIAKIQGAIFGATECQPGPCAAFRISVLKSVLIPWYCQKVFGHRTITNEDRHLTTRILLAGYTVHYAPDAVIYTETPNNLDGWVKQQVRWSRGTMIETLWYPRMINRLYPWHIYNILKARSIPLITFWFTTSYALGLEDRITKISTMVLIDIFCMIALQVTYIVHLGPDSTSPSDIIWLLPSIVWFFLMSPGIVVWSLVTILDDSWGNLPRAIGWRSATQSEESADTSQFTSRARKPSLELKYVGFQILWLIIIMVAICRAFDLF